MEIKKLILSISDDIKTDLRKATTKQEEIDVFVNAVKPFLPMLGLFLKAQIKELDKDVIDFSLKVVEALIPELKEMLEDLDDESKEIIKLFSNGINQLTDKILSQIIEQGDNLN